MMTTLRLPKVAGVCIIQSLDDVVDMHAISPSEVYLASGLSKKSYDTECPKLPDGACKITVFDLFSVHDMIEATFDTPCQHFTQGINDPRPGLTADPGDMRRDDDIRASDQRVIRRRRLGVQHVE